MVASHVGTDLLTCWFCTCSRTIYFNVIVSPHMKGSQDTDRCTRGSENCCIVMGTEISRSFSLFVCFTVRRPDPQSWQVGHTVWNLMPQTDVTVVCYGPYQWLLYPLRRKLLVTHGSEHTGRSGSVSQWKSTTREPVWGSRTLWRSLPTGPFWNECGVNI